MGVRLTGASLLKVSRAYEQALERLQQESRQYFLGLYSTQRLGSIQLID
jgi:hypothetical protein